MSNHTYLFILSSVKHFMKNPPYLVRPHDSHIYELDESNDCYRSYLTRNVRREDGTRPNAEPNFTFENLTSNYDFFPIKKDEIKEYEEKNKFHGGFNSWKCRSDGHGGIKGGNLEGYLRYLERVKLFNKRKKSKS